MLTFYSVLRRIARFASEELTAEFVSQDSMSPVTPDSGFSCDSPFRGDCPVGFGTTGHHVGTKSSRFLFPQVTYEEVAKGTVPTVRAALVRNSARVDRKNSSTFSPTSTLVYRHPIHFRNMDIR